MAQNWTTLAVRTKIRYEYIKAPMCACMSLKMAFIVLDIVITILYDNNRKDIDMQKCLFCGCNKNIKQADSLLCKSHKAEMDKLKEKGVSIFYCPFCLLNYTKESNKIPKYYRSDQKELFKDDPNNKDFHIIKCEKCERIFFSKKNT